ncbi:MAG TPA: PIG-L deacetylase family protein [Candidatus Saccharimonadales bacterium]|nr:PIG-L deacetylase family protein [Candidatus Saccharimonadales bacterium]
MSTVLGVFAHPDDEAFFTGGTIATLAKDHDVYTICITNGDAGENSSDKDGDLAEIRKAEVLEAGKILGVKETVFLGYKDGALSNNLYHEIATKIEEIVDKLRPEILLTFEPRGISGHIDHIVTSMVTSYIFKKSEIVKELWYCCNNEEIQVAIKDYYIYWPAGYKKSEISKVIDIESVWETKVAAMHKHESQIHDVEWILGLVKNLPKEENIIILKK